MDLRHPFDKKEPLGGYRKCDLCDQKATWYNEGIPPKATCDKCHKECFRNKFDCNQEC